MSNGLLPNTLPPDQQAEQANRQAQQSNNQARSANSFAPAGGLSGATSFTNTSKFNSQPGMVNLGTGKVNLGNNTLGGGGTYNMNLTPAQPRPVQPPRPAQGGLLQGAATRPINPQAEQVQQPQQNDMDLFMKLAANNQPGRKRDTYQPLVGLEDWHKGWDSGMSNGTTVDINKISSGGKWTKDLRKDLINAYLAKSGNDTARYDKIMNAKINPLTGLTTAYFLNFNKGWDTKVESHLANTALAHITGLSQTTDPRVVEWFKSTFPDWKERARAYAQQYVEQYKQNQADNKANAIFNYQHSR